MQVMNAVTPGIRSRAFLTSGTAMSRGTPCRDRVRDCFSNPQVPQTMTAAMTRLRTGSIQFAPVQKMARAAENHAEGHGGIGHHVQEGAADVEILLAAHEEEGREAVHDDADAGDDHHGAGGNRSRLDQAPDGFPTMPPIATSRSSALKSAARIELERRP